MTASVYSLEKAAQAWCADKTSSTVMDSDLAVAFADILDAELDRLRVQLAGCSVAALGVGIDHPVAQNEYGWSASYQDVVDLRVKYNELTKETT